MDAHRVLNPDMPRHLVWAQIGLYALVLYAAVRQVAMGRFPAEESVIALVGLLAASGIAGEVRWAWRFGVVTCVASLVPALDELVRDPAMVLRPSFTALIVAPVLVLFCLLSPEARDHQRTWFR